MLEVLFYKLFGIVVSNSIQLKLGVLVKSKRVILLFLPLAIMIRTIDFLIMLILLFLNSSYRGCYISFIKACNIVIITVL